MAFTCAHEDGSKERLHETAFKDSTLSRIEAFNRAYSTDFDAFADIQASTSSSLVPGETSTVPISIGPGASPHLRILLTVP